MSQNVPTPEKPENSKPKRRYKKRTKKVSPTNGVLSDAPKEAREIPLYDPQTGEPNPYYEELTGKPNPLMTPKGFTIDGVAEKSRTEYVKKELHFDEPKKDYLDVKTNNRFLVIFPKEFGITPIHVKSVKRPSISIIKRGILGTRLVLSPVIIELIDLIEENFKLNVRLNEILNECKPFNLRIETVNPKGLVVEEMLLAECVITKMNFSPLSYDNDSLSVTTVTIQPREYSIK